MSIEIFPVLYKNNNKGKVTEWRVHIEPAASGTYHIVTQYGETTGKKVTHIKEVTAGKVKRTVLEQAILETRSKWNEKHDRDAFRPVVADVTAAATRPVPPTIMRPMLANTYDPPDLTGKSRAYRMPFPCFVQRKLDGIRCIALGPKGAEQVVMESRKGTPICHFDHIRRAVADLVADGSLPRDLCLDGELYTADLNFEVISGLVRQKTEKKGKNAVQDTAKMVEQMHKIQYYVYDVYVPSQPLLTFRERLVMLERLRAVSPVIVVATETVESHEAVKRKHDQYVGEGFEGIMLRDPLGPYEPNKRSKYLQKYKEFMEEEFKIVGFHDGDGVDKGLVIWECALPDGRQFSVKPRGTHEARREAFLTANTELGRNLTVIFQEYSAEGVPRFPVGKAIRTDI